MAVLLDQIENPDGIGRFMINFLYSVIVLIDQVIEHLLLIKNINFLLIECVSNSIGFYLRNALDFMLQ